MACGDILAEWPAAGGGNGGCFGVLADAGGLPEAGEGEGFVRFEPEVDGAALAEGVGFPFIKSIGWEQAAALAEGFFEGAFGGEGFSAGIDERARRGAAPGGDKA